MNIKKCRSGQIAFLVCNPKTKKGYEVTIVEVDELHNLVRISCDVRRLEETEWVDPVRLRFDSMTTTDEKPARKEKRDTRHCNLCGREFRARSRFMRFCDVCKGRSEVYRFAGT